MGRSNSEKSHNNGGHQHSKLDQGDELDFFINGFNFIFRAVFILDLKSVIFPTEKSGDEVGDQRNCKKINRAAGESTLTYRGGDGDKR